MTGMDLSILAHSSGVFIPLKMLEYRHNNKDFYMQSILSFVSFLSGKKTYALGLVAILYGVSGFLTGHLDANSATDTIWAGLAVITGRAAIAKVE